MPGSCACSYPAWVVCGHRQMLRGINPTHPKLPSDLRSVEKIHLPAVTKRCYPWRLGVSMIHSLDGTSHTTPSCDFWFGLHDKIDPKRPSSSLFQLKCSNCSQEFAKRIDSVRKLSPIEGMYLGYLGKRSKYPSLNLPTWPVTCTSFQPASPPLRTGS